MLILIKILKSFKSEIDGRQYISFPLVNTKKIQECTKKSQSCISHNLPIINVVDSTIYPSKDYLKSWIQGIEKYTIDTPIKNKIISHENKELTIDELVEQYYPNPEDYFSDDKKEAKTDAKGQGVTI
jgi:hypothetical protein